MGELYNPYPKLPKNIRQIGERDQIVKLYLEDYVNTYLQKLFPAGGQDLRVGLLLGSSEQYEGTPYLFVDGALEMDGVNEDGEKVEFTESAWKKAYEEMEEMFPKRTVLGWFLCGAQDSQLSPLNYWKEHVKYFPGKNQLMYLNSGLEGEEAIYVTSEDGFYKLRGHCIYYERNQMMQDYMILRGGKRRVETGVQDNVVRDFRQRSESRRTEMKAQKSTIGVLGGLCSALAVVVMAGGITMFNNYEKMRQMESVMVSVLPEGVTDWKEYDPKTEKEKLSIEEVPGQVYPTQEVEHYTMAHESEPESGQAANGKPSNSLNTDPAPGESGAQVSASPESAAETQPATQAPQETEAAAAVPDTYIIGEGETLHGICLRFYHNLSMMDEICRLNGIDDPNKIISGQKLVLP